MAPHDHQSRAVTDIERKGKKMERKGERRGEKRKERRRAKSKFRKKPQITNKKK
jgi:hypothetical protein